jgi:hypothetical protein
MTLLAHVDALRALAQLDPETTLLELAIVGVLEELAAELDRLSGNNDPPGLGSVWGVRGAPAPRWPATCLPQPSRCRSAHRCPPVRPGSRPACRAANQ